MRKTTFFKSGFSITLPFFMVLLLCAGTKIFGQTVGIKTGATFNWADTQSTLSDSATLESVDIDGVNYNTFVVPSTYEMTRLGRAGNNGNHIQLNGTQILNSSGDPDWNNQAIAAYQSKNLNHYFESNGNGDNFCDDFTGTTTNNSQIQTIRYSPGIPSNPDGILAVTERGANNCQYLELYGVPAGGGTEQLLGTTFVRTSGNLRGVQPQAPPVGISDYWSSGRNNDNNQVIGIALFKLSDIAPVGSVITSIRYFAATTDNGDGKFFIMQTYAEDDTIEIKLDREGNGDIASNDMTPEGSTYTLTQRPSNGTITFSATGAFKYVPNPGFTGTDSFEISVCLPAPNTSVCDTATAIIVIKLEAIFDNQNVSQNSANNSINILDNDNFGSSGPRANGAITNFTAPINGSAALDDNGTPTDSYDDYFSYTPNTGFLGTDFFTYEITDGMGSTDVGYVYISIAPDTDLDAINDLTDLDDDNDGIIDSNEAQECIEDDYFAWELSAPIGTRTNDVVENPAITNWLISETDDITIGSGLSADSPSSELQLSNMNATTYAESLLQNEFVQVGFTTATELLSPQIERLGMSWHQNSDGSSIGNSYDVAVAISKDNFATSILLYSDIRIHFPSDGVYEFFDLLPVGTSFNLEENTAYRVRIYTYNQQNDGNVGYSVFDDFTVRVSACSNRQSDGDGVADHLDTDSDDDSCPDTREAGHTDPDGDGLLGTAPLTVDENGLVTGQGGYSGTNASVITPMNPVTIVTHPNDVSAQIGGSVSFDPIISGGDNLTFQWEEQDVGSTNWTPLSDGNNISGANTTLLTINPVSSAENGKNYRLIVTNSEDLCNPIMTTGSANLEVQGMEEVFIELNVCIGDPVIDLMDSLPANFERSGIYTMTAGNASVNGSSFDPLNLEVGNYSITYVAESGTYSYTAYYTIIVTDECVACDPDNLIVSKTITANGDGINDYFELEGLENCGYTYDIAIFNRWGNMVFQGQDYQNDWGGIAPDSSVGNAINLPSGTYYYTVTLRNTEFKPVMGYIYIGSN